MMHVERETQRGSILRYVVGTGIIDRSHATRTPNTGSGDGEWSLTYLFGAPSASAWSPKVRFTLSQNKRNAAVCKSNFPYNNFA